MNTQQIMSDYQQGYEAFHYFDKEQIKFESIEFKRGYEIAEKDENKTELRSIEDEYTSNNA